MLTDTCLNTKSESFRAAMGVRYSGYVVILSELSTSVFSQLYVLITIPLT